MINIAYNAFRKTIFNSQKLSKIVGFSFASNSPFEGLKKSMPFYDNKLQTRNVIAHNVGVKSFLTRVYITAAFSICGAIGVAYVGMSLPVIIAYPYVPIILGSAAAIKSFNKVCQIEPKVIAENKPGVPAPVYRTQNPISRIVFYTIGVASLGISASPFFYQMHLIMPSIITSSIGITIGIFGGASAIAYMLPKDKMIGYGNILSGSLTGLILMQLVGIGAAFFMGPNDISNMLFNIDTYGGLVLFTCYIAYDTHLAIKCYEEGYADHLGLGALLFLHLWNILLRVMQVMSKWKK